jgi:hypothetical protein
VRDGQGGLRRAASPPHRTPYLLPIRTHALQDVPSLVDVRLRQAFGAGQANLAASRAALATALAAIRTHLVSYTCTAVTNPETFVSTDDEGDGSGSGASSSASSGPAVMLSGAGTTGHAELLAFLTPPAGADSLPPPRTFLEALLAHARSEGGDCVRDVFAPLFREAAARLAARSPPSENPFAGEEGMADDDDDDDDEGSGNGAGQPTQQQVVRTLARNVMRDTGLPIANLPPPWVAEALGGGAAATGGGSGGGSSSSSSSSAAAATAAAAKKAAASVPPPSLLRPDSFLPLLSLLSQLTRQGDLVKALVSDPAYGWGADVVAAAQVAGAAAATGTASGPPPAGATGKDVERRTFLGQLLSLGPQEDDYRGGPSSSGSGPAAVNAADDLLTGWLNTTRKGDGSDGQAAPRGVGDEDTDDGVARDNSAVLVQVGAAAAKAGLARMLPPLATSPAELEVARKRYTSALEATQTALRNGGAAFLGYACGIVDNIVKKGGKDAVFNWVGGLYDANGARTMSAYEWAQPSPAITGLSSSALLFNASRAMLALCEPFLGDPCSPKTARIDLRYVSNTVPNGSGGGRFHMRRGEERLAPFIDYSEGAGGSGSGGSGADAGSTQPSWIDARNYARQHQFRERHKAMVAAALGGNKGGSGGAGVDVTDGGASSAAALSLSSPWEDVYAPLGSAPSSAPLAWHPITEMFWLAVRGVHLADTALRARDGRLRESLAGLRAQRFKLAALLRRVPGGGVVTTAARGGATTVELGPQAVLTQHTAQYVSNTRVGRRAVAAMHASHALVFNAHPDALAAPLRLYRLLAVVLTRAVVPTSARYVGGAVDDAWHVLGGPTAKEGGGGGGAAAGAPKGTTAAPAAATTAPIAATGGGGGGTGLTPVLGGMTLAVPRPVSPVNLGDAAASTAHVVLVPPPLGPPPAAIPPITTVALPLLPPSAVVCGLPEHLLHDMATWARALGTSNAPYHVLVSGGLPFPALSDLLTALLAFLGSPLHVHNPYARGDIVGALTVFAPFRHDPLRKPGGERLGLPTFFNLLPTHPLAVASLAPSLTAFHVDIEYSGSHTVFYDKFQHRANTTSLLEWLWTTWPAHRSTLESYATSPATAGRFIKFANAVTADVGYHMEEALKALAEVREVQRERANAAEWAALDAEMRKDKEQKLLNAEYSARGSLHNASEQLGLLAALAATPGGAGSLSSAGASKLGAAWLCPDIRDRVSQGLGYYLDSLVGESRNKLRVDNPAALNWRPRDVLLALVTIYNNLAAVPPGDILVATAASSGGGGAGAGSSSSSSGADAYAAAGTAATVGGDADPWAAAIVRDGRSFHPDNFVKAQAVLLDNGDFVREHANAPSEAERLKALHARVLAAASATAADEEVLGDVPDVLTDPLLGELMRDPVLLPTSRNIVDRSTAKRMLLDEERDPFNREYLTLDMLKPLPELAAALADWVAAKKRGDTAAADAAVRWAGALVEAAGDPAAARAALAGGGSGGGSSSSSKAAAAPAPAPAPAPVPLPVPPRPAAAAPPNGGAGSDMDEDDEELRAALALSSGEAPAGGAVPPAAGSGAGGSASDEEIDDELSAALALSMREATGEQQQYDV